MGRNLIEILIKAQDEASAKMLKVANSTESAFNKATQGAKIVMAAGMAAEAALFGVIYKTSEWAHELEHLSVRLGATTEFLSAMEYAIKVSGGEIGNFQTAMRVMSQASYEASKGGKEQIRIFDDLGVSFLDASGKLKPLETLFFDVADAIARQDDETLRLALATKIFGRGSMDLIPLLRQGSAGIRELMDRAKMLGGVLGGDVAEKSDKFQASLIDIKTAMRGVGMELVDSFGPELTTYSEKLATEVIPRTREWIESNKGFVETAAKVTGELTGMSVAFLALATMANLAKSNPIIAALFTGATAGIITAKGIEERWGNPLEKLIDYFERLKNKAKEANEEINRSQNLIIEGKGLYTIPPLGPAVGPLAGIAFDRVRAQYAEGQTQVSAAIKKAEDLHAALVPLLSDQDKLAKGAGKAGLAMKGFGETSVDTANNIIRALEKGLGGKEEVPAMVNSFANQWKAGLEEFNLDSVDIARDMTRTFGGMFSQIAQKGANAAEIFDQAWRSAIGNVASRLAEMAIWKVGGAIATGILTAFLFHGGGEFAPAQQGLEVYGGSYDRDTVPVVMSRGEVAIPSPTVKRLNRFMDRSAESANTVVVNPLFFSGSKQDSQLAAEYIRRRLEGNSQFVIEGAL
jgi:hypothetical protein